MIGMHLLLRAPATLLCLLSLPLMFLLLMYFESEARGSPVIVQLTVKVKGKTKARLRHLLPQRLKVE